MSGSYFPEEMDGSFFDDILGDVPEIDGPGEGDLFLANWPPADTDSLTVSDSVFSANSNLDLSAELSVSYEDIVQFERLTNFVDDSLTGEQNLTLNDNETWPPAAETQIANNPFQTSSPVSVLESGSPCSGDKTLPYGPTGIVDEQQVNIPVLRLVDPPKAPTSGAVKKRGRARSKRSRPTSPILPIAASGKRAIRATGETGLVIRFPKQFLSGQKEKKMKISRDHEEEDEEEEEPKEKQCTMRKCMHCESTKTPQWRAGPMGPKTLCNACGVRYKTGRLFPEYRPAASPTFVPTIHSNSHKKVVEMRKKSGDSMTGGGPVRSSTSLDY